MTSRCHCHRRMWIHRRSKATAQAKAARPRGVSLPVCFESWIQSTLSNISRDNAIMESIAVAPAVRCLVRKNVSLWVFFDGTLSCLCLCWIRRKLSVAGSSARLSVKKINL
mmetsp:Transcript_648/g.1536  ORF Transcript_648/g.1536 Transcript_648/m.1536 type:complete len:111 (-) Transcript_648:71-403(-)